MDLQFVDIILVDAGPNKLNVIQALREASTKVMALEMLELARAKQLIDTAPSVIASNQNLEIAEQVRSLLENAGATVQLKNA